MPEKVQILVADDEQSMRSFLSDVLTGAGYKVKTVPDAEKALDEIKENGYEGCVKCLSQNV